MELHNLKRAHTLKKAHRVGRGGKRGKTSGRGGKGQTARAGNKRRPEWRDIIKKIPKRRGYGKNRGRTVVPQRPSAVVNLGTLSKRFKAGEEVTPRALLERGLVRRSGGTLPSVKVLRGGELDKKLSFRGVLVSEAARGAIEKQGGSINDSRSRA